MKTVLDCDFVVCGGGLSGICAAIAAARHGLKTVLCEASALLGGNSNSEYRVWICGAVGMGNNRYAEECGIIGEITMENLYRNKEGNSYLWDALLLDFVQAESNITLLLNTRITKVQTEDACLDSVTGFQHTTERIYELKAPFFADCTGDGAVAVMAGAAWVRGSRDEDKAVKRQFDMDESDYSLGSTILYQTKKSSKPVKFIPPNFAYRKEEIEEVMQKTGKTLSPDANGCDNWWIEYGGSEDTIADSETIGMELKRIVFGIWDYIKNSGKFAAENLTLEWVGATPGRRESRRIIALRTLGVRDVFEQHHHPDAVCYGGWPIDIHPSAGFFDQRESCNQIDVGVYDIPLGSLLCKDIGNLLLAGRNAGMTHAAMASARVMKTCALMGQAAGTAAAFARRKNLPLTRLGGEIEAMQQCLLKDDVWIIGRKNADQRDLARTSRVCADSHAPFDTGGPSGYLAMDEDLCVILPPLPPGTVLQVPLKINEGDCPGVEIWCSGKGQNYDMKTMLGVLPLTPGGDGWANISAADWGHGNIVLHFPACPGAALGICMHEFPGALGCVSKNAKGLRLFYPAVRAASAFDPFRAENVTDGYNRPYGGMHLWVAFLGASLQLALPAPSDISEIHLYFENSLSRDYNNLNPGKYHKGWESLPPNLAKDIQIEFVGGSLSQTIAIKQNRQRHVAKIVDARAVSLVKVHILNNWGGQYAAVYEVRLY